MSDVIDDTPAAPEVEPKRGPGRPPNAEKVLPAKIKMLMQWSYFTPGGEHRMWPAGTVVDDYAEIKQIIVDCKFKHYEVVK